ncbi:MULTISPECIES: MarR family winged helix-turn-helix transcriptional regulator [Streptomyces]|uniref:MarR family winged helix-turn-helix transcriptional regulator n=1 Tax=Streptomyces TaxID=1883 RepID=UPI0015C5000B|nr:MULTISPECIES: MarR family transcriptional regulator [Streptomyces]MDX3631909.1 MarR family transcriptional regulator [Streptomyces europaeiscabiei]MDX3649997.1 MarR family transcriptional regulator [Streptomyces europaeiscabiei]WUD36798.1 MarR family transcriptional regulator [Streptomyces europaeiscabiei]
MVQALQLDACIGYLIRRCEQVHTALWAAHVSRGITSQQFAVLNTVARRPEVDQRTLSQEASLDRSTVNVIVRRLVDRGCVQQVRHERDRRRTILCLTPDGARLLEELIPPARHINQQMLESSLRPGRSNGTAAAHGTGRG